MGLSAIGMSIRSLNSIFATKKNVGGQTHKILSTDRHVAVHTRHHSSSRPSLERNIHCMCALSRGDLFATRGSALSSHRLACLIQKRESQVQASKEVISTSRTRERLTHRNEDVG